MLSPLTIREPEAEDRILRTRVTISMVFMVVLMVLLLLRLADIQILSYQHFTALSQGNSVKAVPIFPPRGMIYSRDGQVLVENRPTLSLAVTPEKLGNINQAIDQLRQIITLTDEDIVRFHRERKRKRIFDKVTLRLNLSEDEIARFSVKRHLFPGADIESMWTRVYHNSPELSHIIGYVGRVDDRDLKELSDASYGAMRYIGKTGVEKSYESVLRGKIGYQNAEVNVEGRIVRTLKRIAPEAGKDIYLSIDTSLQTKAVELLGKQTGAVVAIEPKTGAVLALASSPHYDNKLFENGIGFQQYRELQNAPGRPLFHRAIQAKYPPGSTVKPFMALAGLHYGLRQPKDQTMCPGFYKFPGFAHQYRCWNRRGHGRVNMRQAIARSCDVYFYVLAKDLGIDRLHNYMSQFGFGLPTGIDLPGESGGLLPSREWKEKNRNATWLAGETIITGIGQGYFSATPVQLATATAILANRGVLVKPRVISQIRNSVTNEIISNLESVENKPVGIASNYWPDVIEAMKAVVHAGDGTANAVGYRAAYRFAGKTGTSQVYGIKQGATANRHLPKHLQDHALFIAFAPVENPRIAAAVIVEHGGGGSKAAAPLARRLFDHYLLRAPPPKAVLH